MLVRKLIHVFHRSYDAWNPLNQSFNTNKELGFEDNLKKEKIY